MSLLLLLAYASAAQAQQQVDWIEFDALTPRMRSEVRPIIVQIGTTWCGYCKMMDEKVYKDALTANYVNDHFYALKLDAESKEEIKFLGKTYRFVPSGPHTGKHQLADVLASQHGTVQYPTIVILDSQLQAVFRHASYLGPEELLEVLKQIKQPEIP